MKASPPVLRSDSSEIEPVTAGERIVILTVVQSQIDHVQPIKVITEVRDSDGFTEMLTWNTGQIAAGGAVDVGVSWIPQKGDDYVLRTFVLNEVEESPSILSDIAESVVTVASR